MEGMEQGFLLLYRKEEKRGIWNAAFTLAGRLHTAATRWNTTTARSVWTSAGPVPTPATTAKPGRNASSGNSAARRPKSSARRSKIIFNLWELSEMKQIIT
jgi:hypothetical protein